MNISYLDEFVYLADSLSFRRTADHFYVSRSVISRHVATLEETVGARLLDRGNRGVNLTEAGRVFYREARAVLRDWDVALERVRTVGEGGATIVRMGYLRNAARPILVHYMRHMTEVHPELHISLTCMEYNELRRAMDEHTVDVALAVNVHPSLSRHYRSTSIYKDNFFAVCSNDHPLASYNDGLGLDDLRGQKLLLPDSYINAGLAEIFDDLVDEKLMFVAQSFYRDIEMLYLKVQTEGYIALSSSMTNAIFGNRLAILPMRDIDTSFTVSAFYHDEFIGEACQSCREGFLWCRDKLPEWEPELDFSSLAQGDDE